MKYLKTYNESRISDINNEIEDIFLSLTDVGFNLQSYPKILEDTLEIDIDYILEGPDGDKFNIEKVRDTLIFLYKFLKENNMSMTLDVGYLRNDPNPNFGRENLENVLDILNFKSTYSILFINIYVRLIK